MKPYFEWDSGELFNADCMDVLPTLSGIDAVVTSPPYNQLASINAVPSGMWAKSHGGAGFVRAITENGYTDEMDESDYQRWQLEVFGIAATVCNDSASLFYNHQMRWRDGNLLHPVKWFQPNGWNLKQEIIWDKAGGMMMNARMFCRFDERILWFTKGQHKWQQSEVGNGTVWRIARYQQQQGKRHPTAFPLAIPTRCISATTEQNDKVLDPFAGSGTTAIACLRTGRRFVGCEIEEKYCAIAKRRIEDEIAGQTLYRLAESKE